VFKRTREGVMERTGGKQIPAEYSRLVGQDIFLAGPAPVKPVEVANHTELPRPADPVKSTEESAPKAPAVSIPTLAEINKLAAAGDTTVCIEALHTYVRSRGAGDGAATPLATLLERVKESLRDPKTAAQNAPQALQDCNLILSALTDCLPADHVQHATLSAKAFNRQGDALLLLRQPQDALASFDTAARLDPADGYVLYNRGRALLAMNRKDEARADFATAAGARFKRSGVHRLAQEALAAMK
jgi:tetratricopeptide (TPR) repeat protein